MFLKIRRVIFKQKHVIGVLISPKHIVYFIYAITL